MHERGHLLNSLSFVWPPPIEKRRFQWFICFLPLFSFFLVLLLPTKISTKMSTPFPRLSLSLLRTYETFCSLTKEFFLFTVVLPLSWWTLNRFIFSSRPSRVVAKKVMIVIMRGDLTIILYCSLFVNSWALLRNKSTDARMKFLFGIESYF